MNLAAGVAAGTHKMIVVARCLPVCRYVSDSIPHFYNIIVIARNNISGTGPSSLDDIAHPCLIPCVHIHTVLSLHVAFYARHPPQCHLLSVSGAFYARHPPQCHLLYISKVS